MFDSLTLFAPSFAVNATPVAWTKMNDTVLIEVRVTPRAARDAVTGFVEGVLRVRLQAPPVEGKANESLRRLLAERLGLPQRNVELVAGQTGRTKQVRITGLARDQIEARLGTR
jgi:uncharacterized protein (TIGR00251 family)